MIRRLRLENFRRHADTELVFDADDQIIAVTGRNGVGKSSILESVLFGLYGESRQGARHLDKLVRRGAELEGMEVELEFALGADTYRVVRRRDGRAASAVLFGNDNPLMEGTRQVTAAVADLLGMDAAGFRLAVVAQQRELDGLTRLGSTDRARMVARLLRLDAVSRARDDARARYREAEAGLSAIPAAADLATAAAEVATAEAELDAARAAEAACRAEIARLEAAIAGQSGVAERYNDARRALAAAEATLAAAEAESARTAAELAAVVVPDADVVVPDEVLDRLGLAGRDLDTLDTDTLAGVGADIERAIATAEAARTAAEQRRATEADLAEVTGRLAAIAERLAVLGSAEACAATVADAHTRAQAHRADASELAARRDALREDYADAKANVDVARRAADAASALDATCSTCGQDIPDTHRQSQIDTAATALAEATARAEALVAEGRQVTEALNAAEAAAVAAETEAAAATDASREAAALEGEQTELGRRRDTYTARLERMGGDAGDVDDAYARKGDLAIVIGAVRAAEETRRARDAALGRIADLELASAAAAVRVEEARAAVEAARPDPALVEAAASADATADALRAELDLAAQLAAATAAAEGRVNVAVEARNAANVLVTRRREITDRGVIAAGAVTLLDDVGGRLTAAVRPALEGTVSDLLVKLSDGRFSSAKLSDDYAITVLDDGSYRALADFSGGEQDLIALALRLGLAAVVSDRSGAACPLLILDEVFGSQDLERRETIMGALRGLRTTYGQVWCISHVPGVEEVADRIIELELDPDSGVAQAA